jgi:general secretion pathway protein A
MSRPRWLSHFGFDGPPFSKELADEQLWVPSSRHRVLDRLVEACHERTHVLLTGEPGVGKTCVLRALRQRLPPARFRLTYCHNATLGRRDFYRHICLALGLHPKATAAAVFFAITEHVQQQEQDRTHPVFLLDEAHLLHQQVLSHLHILANYEWDSAALLSLVLVGLPELDQRMRLRVNRSLYSRIGATAHYAVALVRGTAAPIPEGHHERRASAHYAVALVRGTAEPTPRAITHDWLHRPRRWPSSSCLRHATSPMPIAQPAHGSLEYRAR